MSSRSIGVTNVWLSRLKMSCVIRSPSCSASRMSRASDDALRERREHLVEHLAGAGDVQRRLLEEVEELAVLGDEDLGQPAPCGGECR